MMNYPLISEYMEAIKAAEDNFKELTNLRPVLGEDGQPIMTSGNFAVVFKMKDEETGKLYALKCFTKEQQGREEAYHQIAEELKNVDSPYLVSLRYLEKELFVDTEQTDEAEFPVLLMDWVEGKTLDKYLRENLDDKYALEMLAYRFSQMAQWLIPQPFAHGDLKPDNIIVREDGSLVLVDYDGMYVPSMKGQKARELGSPDFRHPLRTENDFDEHIDDFSITSILLSLRAIFQSPHLLKRYGASDRLLLSDKDYIDIAKSELFKTAFPSGDRIADKLFSLLCIVYYDGFINQKYVDLLMIRKPVYQIPYRTGIIYYSIYEKISGELHWEEYNYLRLELNGCMLISNNKGGEVAVTLESTPNDLWLSKIIKEKYLNPSYIKNIDRYLPTHSQSWEIQLGDEHWPYGYAYGNEFQYFTLTPYGDLVHVGFQWNQGNRLYGRRDFISIGFADENMCYWNIDVDYLQP